MCVGHAATEFAPRNQFIAGGELFARLQRHSCFSCEAAKFYLGEVFLALSHIHKRGYVYRDLKPEK